MPRKKIEKEKVKDLKIPIPGIGNRDKIGDIIGF